MYVYNIVLKLNAVSSCNNRWNLVVKIVEEIFRCGYFFEVVREIYRVLCENISFVGIVNNICLEISEKWSNNTKNIQLCFYQKFCHKIIILFNLQISFFRNLTYVNFSSSFWKLLLKGNWFNVKDGTEKKTVVYEISQKTLVFENTFFLSRNKSNYENYFS